MKITTNLGLAVALVAGYFPAQAQQADVQAELASQKERIAELEKKISAPPSITEFKFPKELVPYVVVEMTVKDTNNVNAAGRSKIDMPNAPWFSADRWGLMGTIDTGVSDFSLRYELESGFGIADGGMSSTNVITAATPAGTTPTNSGTEPILFARSAWIAIFSPTYGKLSFGRQDPLARDFSGCYSYAGSTGSAYSIPYDENGWPNSNNYADLINYAACLDGSRMNKGIVWKKIMTNGFAMGLAYNLADNTLVSPYANNVTQATNSTRDTTGCVALGFNGKGYTLAGFYTQANNAGLTQKSYSVGGNVFVTRKLRLTAGVFRYSADQGPVNGQRHDLAYNVGAAYSPSTKWTYAGGFVSEQAIHAGLSAVSNGNMTAPFSNGPTAKAVGSGTKSVPYGHIMCHLNKASDVYVAADYMNLSNAYRLAATNGYRSQYEFAVGIKFRTFQPLM